MPVNVALSMNNFLMNDLTLAIIPLSGNASLAFCMSRLVSLEFHKMVQACECEAVCPINLKLFLQVYNEQVPVTMDLSMKNFLLDDATLRDWNYMGLPGNIYFSAYFSQ